MLCRIVPGICFNVLNLLGIFNSNSGMAFFVAMGVYRQEGYYIVFDIIMDILPFSLPIFIVALMGFHIFSVGQRLRNSFTIFKRFFSQGKQVTAETIQRGQQIMERERFNTVQKIHMTRDLPTCWQQFAECICQRQDDASVFAARTAKSTQYTEQLLL